MADQFARLATVAPQPLSTLLRALSTRAGPAIARVAATRLRHTSALGLLLADSVTPTTIAAGYKSNVVPGRARASFDSRLLPDTDVEEFIAWAAERAGRHRARVDDVVHAGHGPVSGKGPLFQILEQASSDVAPGAVPVVSLTPGITDLRFFRARGATGYGWVPLVLTPELLAGFHGDDERLVVDDFQRAVRIMADVVVRACT